MSIVSSTNGSLDGHLSVLQQLHQFLMALLETHILFSNGPIPKVSELDLVLMWYHETGDKQFQYNLQVKPSTFNSILQFIEGDPVFMSGGSPNQFPVEHQLAIALFCFGHFGNVVSVKSVAQWAGCSAGTVVTCT
jgi:hypothetical protein